MPRALAGAALAGEENPSRRPDAVFGESLRVAQRPGDQLRQQALYLRKAAHVLPADLGHLRVELAGGGGLDLFGRRQEVAHLHHEGGEEAVPLRFREPGQGRRRLADRQHAGFPAERGDVRPDVTVGEPGERRQVDVVRERHPARVDAEDLRRPALSGTGISTSRSKRPGRRKAGSRRFGMLVAPMTTTSPRETRPSMSARSWPVTRFSTSPMVSDRFGASASISSRKRMLGALRRASSNTSRSLASLSP